MWAKYGMLIIGSVCGLLMLLILSNARSYKPPDPNVPICRNGFLYDYSSNKQIINENGGGIRCDK